MDLGIAGKIALVTAGTRGIGLGIATALAAEGVRVAVAARTEAEVKRTAAAIRGVGIVAFGILGFCNDRALMAVRRWALRGQLIGTTEQGAP